MKELTWEVNAVPEWLMQEYLVELGGQVNGPGQVRGAGWQAEFQKIEDFKLGAISVGRVRLRLAGEESALEAILPRLERKLMRGGG
ncbi:MAG: DUF1952 domain-containing protein [Anaerolineales bacterium]